MSVFLTEITDCFFSIYLGVIGTRTRISGLLSSPSQTPSG